MAARIVFLNGTPSVGKSSTARALQQRLAEPHFYLGLDEFRRGYLDRHWLADHGTDRRKGPMDLDQPELHALHDHGCYDLTVDTSQTSVEQVVDRILPVLDDPPRPAAFDRLRRIREESANR
ncbi:phosphotransferase-like protein [Microlunatus parietis]|uniref:Chloramphenicol 3-O-phosphotransferase n=1 Tax=Microlunatus parietis TaxID=682979 RepID=A0A7Y9I2H0_9ACTN|nr:hypothetical protein [Microlunatus parietis]NYE69033.1 chloramphenicol 3-O-phosphotransferase [Microlunatus parietis]